jgi:hypothetical protein
MIYVLIGYMFLFIHRPFEIWPWLGEMHIERVYVFFAGLCWVVAPKRIRFGPCDTAVGFFCVAVLTAWVLSPWADLGQPAVEDYFKYIVFYALLVTSVTRLEDLRKLVLAFLGIMTVYLLHSLWEFRNGRHTFRMGITRLIGVDITLGDPNSFGASIVYTLPFIRLFWMNAQGRLMKLFLAGYAALAAMCILLTGSRSSLLGLVVWAGIVALQSRRRLQYMLVGSVLFVGAFAALPDYLQTRFETIINPDVGPENAKESGQGRLLGITNGLKLWATYPLSGCGPGVWMRATGSQFQSHNMFGQLVGETGTLGLIAFATFLVTLVRQMKRLRRAAVRGNADPFWHRFSGAIGMSVFLLLVEGLFGHNLLRFNWVWYAGFVGIAVSLMREQPVMNYRSRREFRPWTGGAVLRAT